ncbi:T9SS type A sorting domain-containing protein [Moheibacter sediminis]|uniref:Por secretion system C-terminal sorting domain-containing protein n=1 Tax=Moheibacter sediminis TaxID=1434700 RepID=A0A1W1Z0M0_9FLAO|nr:T9SS type A sorting domain-containing protein [Moheibacter sediminis]SMC41936.1 Por secretion system C-terminal sorting domain-containing protein [Moheibacter sediminis]
MKTILSISMLVLGFFSQAQETFNITWMMGISNEDASLTISAGDTVIWTWGDGTPHSVESLDADAPDDFGSEIMSGVGQTYQYTFTDSAVIDYRCGVHTTMMTGTITVEPGMSVEDKFVKNLKYYPSIVKESLNITSLVPAASYEIYDAQGRKVLEGKFANANHSVINTSSLSQGVYFVSVISKDKLKTSFKIVKE